MPMPIDAGTIYAIIEKSIASISKLLTRVKDQKNVEEIRTNLNTLSNQIYNLQQENIRLQKELYSANQPEKKWEEEKSKYEIFSLKIEDSSYNVYIRKEEKDDPKIFYCPSCVASFHEFIPLQGDRNGLTCNKCDSDFYPPFFGGFA